MQHISDHAGLSHNKGVFFSQGTAKDMSKKLTFSHMRKSFTRCKEDLKEKQKEQKKPTDWHKKHEA